ncbi:hypothetical protein AB0I75_32205 [Streptomyces sp. NPDC050273]|uniref:hypothetical protein n=1 Tax=Streptomyces sp. NPDC050273 TaxID=3154933 RepID=UPI0034412928
MPARHLRTITSHEHTAQTARPRPQPQIPTPTASAGTGQKVRAAQADIEATPLYRPGGLNSLQQLRDRGVLGPSTPPA